MSIYNQFSEREQEILRARAQRVANTTQNTPAEQMSSVVLTVAVHGEIYAMPIETLTAVYQDITVVPVPCTPPFVAGIANIRGHLIPVIDLATLLNVSGEEVTGSALAVVTNDDLNIAFRVDSIGEVITIHRDKLTPIPSLMELAKANYLQGTLPDGTILLSITAILSDPAFIIDQTVL